MGLYRVKDWPHITFTFGPWGWWSNWGLHQENKSWKLCSIFQMTHFSRDTLPVKYFCTAKTRLFCCRDNVSHILTKCFPKFQVKVRQKICANCEVVQSFSLAKYSVISQFSDPRKILTCTVPSYSPTLVPISYVGEKKPLPYSPRICTGVWLIEFLLEYFLYLFCMRVHWCKSAFFCVL